MTQRLRPQHLPSSPASPMTASAPDVAEHSPEEWVLLRSFAMPMEAELARGRLLAAGIEAKLADQHTVSMAWHLADAMGGIKLRVAHEDLERALLVLESEPEFPEGWENEVCAPTEPPSPASANDPPATARAWMSSMVWWPGIWLAVGGGLLWTVLRAWVR